jgi:hypothetical protein
LTVILRTDPGHVDGPQKEPEPKNRGPDQRQPVMSRADFRERAVALRASGFIRMLCGTGENHFRAARAHYAAKVSVGK